jgi:Yip1 domain
MTAPTPDTAPAAPDGPSTTGGKPTSLVDRVKAILLSPRTEWDVIETEPATVASLYSNYIIPLAAIPAIAGFIGFSIIGLNVLGTSIRVSMSSGIAGAIVRYALALAGVYVVALVIDSLAPTFGGTRNKVQALKVAAYSSTAAWVAGIFVIIPALGILGILGLYSLYLLYLGLPKLMKAPQEKAMGYTVVVVVVAIVVFVVIGAITGRVMGMSRIY